MINICHPADCNEYMRVLPDKFFDLFEADPPYFDGPDKKKYYSPGYKKVNKKYYNQLKYWDKVTEEFFNQLNRISKYYIFWGENYYNFNFPTGRLIWDKIKPDNDFSDCEIAVTNLFNHVYKIDYLWNGFHQAKSISECKKVNGNKKQNEIRIHQTQKPVNLYKIILQKYAKPGFKIGCSHTGSGSIRIACHDMGFYFEGCELDPMVWKDQEERFKNHISQKELFDKSEIQELIYNR